MRRPYRVAETTRRLLLDVSDVDLFAQPVDFGEDPQQVTPVALSQIVLEVDRAIEVVDDGALAAASHHDHLLDPARDRLLDAVLDRRLVDEGQHLLWLRLGHRQESCAETGRREDRLAHGHGRQSISWRPRTASARGSRAESSAWSTSASSPCTWGAKACSRRRQ